MSAYLDNSAIQLFGSYFIKQCINGNITTVQKCIDGDILEYPHFGTSAFMEAFYNKHYDIMTLLLNNGVKINSTYIRQITDYITENPDQTMVNFLTKHDLIPPPASDYIQEYFRACLHGDSLYISYALIAHNIDITICDELGRTGLMVACQNGHLDVVSNILTYMVIRTTPHIMKKVIQTVDDHGDNLITTTCLHGHTELLKSLISANLSGLDLHHVNNNGENGITLACYNGHHDIVQILFNHGVDIHHVNKFGDNAVMICCYDNHADVSKLLLDNKVKSDLSNNYGYTALSICEMKKSKNCKKLLIM